MNRTLIEAMLRNGLEKGFASWRNMGEPHGFEEAALFIQSKKLADNIGFTRTDGKITMIHMKVNQNGLDYLSN